MVPGCYRDPHPPSPLKREESEAGETEATPDDAYQEPANARLFHGRHRRLRPILLLAIAPVLALEVPLEPLLEFEVGTEDVPVSVSWLILETTVGVTSGSLPAAIVGIKCAILQHNPFDIWERLSSVYRVVQEHPVWDRWISGNREGCLNVTVSR